MPSPKKEIGELLDPILAAFRTRLQVTIMNHAVIAYLKGSAQMVQYGRTITTDKPIFFEGPPMQQAINYANKHSAQLVTKMDAETKDRLAKVIGDAIENKRGIPGLARDIRKEFDNMTKYRSELIARTESCDALEQAFMDRADDLGITGKEWVVVDPCPICEENEAAGVIRIDSEFPSGHLRPPAHPNCRCALAPAMLARESFREGGPGSGNFGHAGRPGEVGGSGGGGGNNIIHGNLRSATHSDGKERMNIVGSDGSILSEKVGSNSQLHLTTEDITVLNANKGSKYIHSHPSDGSFSDDDICVAMKYNINSMEVITPNYIATLKAPKDGYGTISVEKIDLIRSDYGKLVGELSPKWVDAYSNGMSRDEAIQNLSHDVVTQLSSKYNLNYNRRKSG